MDSRPRCPRPPSPVVPDLDQALALHQSVRIADRDVQGRTVLHGDVPVLQGPRRRTGSLNSPSSCECAGRTSGRWSGSRIDDLAQAAAGSVSWGGTGTRRIGNDFSCQTHAGGVRHLRVTPAGPNREDSSWPVKLAVVFSCSAGLISPYDRRRRKPSCTAGTSGQEPWRNSPPGPPQAGFRRHALKSARPAASRESVWAAAE